MALKLDSRQTRQRTKLDQLSTTTDLRLDAIMNLINDELTMPLRMRANLGSGVDGSPDQRLYIDGIFVKTLDSGAADSGHERSRTIPPIGGVLPNYSGSGYIEFNATTGAATASGLTLAGSYSLPSMTNGQFVKVLVWLSATSASVFAFGMEIGVPAASVDAAVLPVPPSDAFALGYVVMTKGATTYSKVLNENIFQFVGGGGSGGGSGASKEITQANSFAVGDVVYYNGTAYAKAQANAANTAEAIGIVSKASASKFTLTELGYVTGLSTLTPGEVYFLSDSVAGGLTVNEPTTIGSVSKPMLIADSATSGYVLNYRGVVVGGANARTQISLTNNGSKDIQPVGSYDAGEMAGWVDLQNSTPANSKRFYVQIQFSKNGPGTDYNVAYQTSGDTPPAGFNVDYNSVGGYIRVTLPNISGLTTAVLNYALNAPAVGTNFPLTVDGSAVTAATALAPGVVSLSNQSLGAGDKYFSGNVGINNTAPTSRLTIGSGTFTSAAAQTTGLYTNGSNGLVVLTDAMSINSRTGTNYANFDSSGNLLVGATSVINTLANGGVQVQTSGNGQIVCRNSSSPAGQYWRNGVDGSNNGYVLYNHNGTGVFISNGGTSWSSSSDERSKKNIKPLQLGLAQIEALKPSSFDYKTDESEDSKRIGFIAQEVLPVLPQAVYSPENPEDMMGVSMTEMIPVMVKAIQELKAELDAVKAELAELKK